MPKSESRRKSSSKKTVLSQSHQPSRDWYENQLDYLEKRTSDVEYKPTQYDIQGLKEISESYDYYKKGFERVRMKTRSDELGKRIKRLKQKYSTNNPNTQIIK